MCVGLSHTGPVHACVFVLLASCRQTSRAKPWIPSTPFEATLQEQHLSPAAFHTLITWMLSLIFPPLWNLSTSEVAPHFTDGPKTCHWHKMSNFTSWISPSSLYFQCQCYIWIKSDPICWIHIYACTCAGRLGLIGCTGEQAQDSNRMIYIFASCFFFLLRWQWEGMLLLTLKQCIYLNEKQ